MKTALQLHKYCLIDKLRGKTMFKSALLFLGILVGSSAFAQVVKEGDAALPVFLNDHILEVIPLTDNFMASVIVKPFIYTNDKTVRLAVSDSSESSVFTIFNTNFKIQNTYSILRKGRCLYIYRQSDKHTVEKAHYLFTETDRDKKEVSIYMFDAVAEQNNTPSAALLTSHYCERGKFHEKLSVQIPSLKPFHTIKYNVPAR